MTPFPNPPTSLADCLDPRPSGLPMDCVSIGQPEDPTAGAARDAWMNRTVDQALRELEEKTALRLAQVRQAREFLTPELAALRWRDVQALYHAL